MKVGIAPYERRDTMLWEEDRVDRLDGVNRVNGIDGPNRTKQRRSQNILTAP